MSDLSEQVQALLDGMVEAGTENGVQAAVYHRGELVVDVVAGVADPATGRAVAPDTVFFAASAVKGVAATVVHVLAERGVLGYDTRIAELWPEFAAHGKQDTTVRHALTHSAGIPVLPKDLSVETFTDWDAMCAVVADLEPRWAPGASRTSCTSGCRSGLSAGWPASRPTRRAPRCSPPWCRTCRCSTPARRS